ncbi:MAG TPA: 4-coumarate--CoA ligase family protein [Blastococcus sp.]|nr:4-coumarate--CoA ligase family protein [Blastococcus sp.]
MALASPYPDVDIPDVSVPELVLAAGRDRPDSPALIDGLKGDVITHGQLAAYVDRVAANLHARGLRKGDVVAVFCPNTPWFPVVFHGIAAAGCVMSSINSLYTPEEIAFQLKDSGARILITISLFMDRAGAAVRESPVDEVIVLDGAEGHANLFDLLGADAPSVQVDIDPATDLVTLPYSSGTTGLPKGVMLTHRNLVANVAQCRPLIRLGEEERIIAVLPFFHIYGLTVLMNQGLAWGAAVVTLPRFDLEDFLRTIQDHRVTRAFVAPPILLALAKHPLVDQYDLSSLVSINSGAAPMAESLALAVQDRLRKGADTGVSVTQGYGMTELSPVSHTTPDEGAEPPGFSGAVPKGSVGFAVPNTECRLVDPGTAEDAAPGERGELWVRGPQVMRGYLNNPEATAATLDREGWLHTGDVAVVDDDGCYTVVDRVKELIKYKGYQVAPAELESVLIGHPEIADAAVIGMPDADSGEELPKAFVVRAPGSELTADAVMAYMSEKVAPHKKIRIVEFIEQVPKSASGKILRKDLRGRAPQPPTAR